MIQKRQHDLRSKMILDTEHDLKDLIDEETKRSTEPAKQRRALLDLFGSLSRRLSFRRALALQRRRRRN